MLRAVPISTTNGLANVGMARNPHSGSTIFTSCSARSMGEDAAILAGRIKRTASPTARPRVGNLEFQPASRAPGRVSEHPRCKRLWTTRPRSQRVEGRGEGAGRFVARVRGTLNEPPRCCERRVPRTLALAYSSTSSSGAEPSALAPSSLAPLTDGSTAEVASISI
jgi:hypothetical protein